jgi:hypothetical protein
MAYHCAGPLTLGWKLIAGGATSSESKIDIVDFLSRQGFEVTRKTSGDYSFIDATTGTTGACRMMIFEVSPDGSTRDIERWSRLSEQIFRVDKWSLCQG